MPDQWAASVAPERCRHWWRYRHEHKITGGQWCQRCCDRIKRAKAEVWSRWGP